MGMKELDAAFPKSLFDGKVVRGKDGWLFLDNDSNLFMSQYSGELRFSEDQLRHWRFLLENRIAWLQARDTSYFFLVPPNSQSVFPEALPDGLGTGEGRPVLQLIEYLRAERSYARIIYPIEELVREKSRCIYTKTGTHWTELGSFLAYRRLMAEINESRSLLVLGEDDLQIREVSVVGDLGDKVVPPESSLDAWVNVRIARARVLADNRVRNTGRRIEYECEEAPPVCCLVFGDSFANRVLPYLAESFARLVFVHMPTLDYGLVEREQPDIVINILNERFLIFPPTDAGAPTHEQREARKRTPGEIRDTVREVMPAGATVAVVSKGDEDLLNLDGRVGWHFPRDEHGEYAGHHPADSQDAIARLGRIRAEGAEYLLIPSTSSWWLEHYGDFAAHLEREHDLVARRDGACVIYRLTDAGRQP
jgi:hypothetical protein